MSALKIVFLIVGLLGLLVALGLFMGGGAITWFHYEFQDDDGFYTTKTVSITSNTNAVTTHPTRIDVQAGKLWHWDDAGTIKVSAQTVKSSKGVFIGIGNTDDVRKYLNNVAYEEITEFHVYPYGADYLLIPGPESPALPTAQPFWAAQVSGSGIQPLEWQLEEGNWMLVLMNDDGSPGVELQGQVGIKIPSVLWIGVGLIIAGVVTFAVSIIFLVLAIRRPKETIQS